MPALNITFTDEEMNQIRATTAEEEISLKSFAHDAVLAEVQRRKVAAATAQVLRLSQGLAKRLADK